MSTVQLIGSRFDINVWSRHRRRRKEARMTIIFRSAAIVAAIFGAAACSTPHAGSGPIDSGPGWTAHGYLTPGMTDDPDIIGTYASERECRAAVDAWMSRQVVGNPVSGECLPVDRR